MTTQLKNRGLTWAFLALLLSTACERASTPSEVLQLPACDPVQPRPPCDPRPTAPSLVGEIRVADGDTQAANVGTALAKPLVVLVTDRSRAPLANVAIRWSTMPGIVLSSDTSRTDAHGLARVQLTVGPTAGQLVTAAEVVGGDAGARVHFTSFALVNGAYRLRLHGGLDQRDTVFARLASAYQVRVEDHRGMGVPGVIVQWRLLGTGSLSDSATTTDAQGIASVHHTLGRRADFETVQAIATGLVDSPSGFVTYAAPGRPISLGPVTNSGQLGVVNKTVMPYEVQAADAYGNRSFGPVVWTVESGGGSLEFINPLRVMHTLGPAPGLQRVSASVPGTETRIEFATNAVSAIVGMGDCYYGFDGFHPSDLEIPVGGAVAWIWYPGYCQGGHDVTFEDDENAGSPTQREATFIRFFHAPGNYRYRCRVHSTNFAEGEVGVVRVR